MAALTCINGLWAKERGRCFVALAATPYTQRAEPKGSGCSAILRALIEKRLAWFPPHQKTQSAKISTLVTSKIFAL